MKQPVKIGDEILGYIYPNDDETRKSIDSILKSKVLQNFLTFYIKEINYKNSEYVWAKNKILESYKNIKFYFDVSYMINKLEKENQLTVYDLLNSEDYINLICKYYNVTEDFVLNLFDCDGGEGSAKIGKGELLLSYFTDLKNSNSKDLIDKNGVIFDGKDNGESGGFRAGAEPGTSSKKVIIELNELFNNSLKIKSYSLNKTENRGNGVFLGEILEKAKKYIKTDKDLEKFIKIFLTFKEQYSTDINIITKDIIKNQNLKDFFSFLGLLQLYGYMKSEGIENLICFSDKKRNIGLIKIMNFKSFFHSYNTNITIGGWEDDSRNVSFRIKYIKNGK